MHYSGLFQLFIDLLSSWKSLYTICWVCFANDYWLVNICSSSKGNNGATHPRKWSIHHASLLLLLWLLLLFSSFTVTSTEGLTAACAAYVQPVTQQLITLSFSPGHYLGHCSLTQEHILNWLILCMSHFLFTPSRYHKR